MFEQHDVEAEKYARAESRDIALVIADRQVADEEQAHSRNAEDDGRKIPQVKFLANHERREYQYIYWGSVLEKDRVCRGRVLGSPDKKKEKYRVDERSDDAKAIYPQAIPAGYHENGYRGEQRAKKCHLIGVKVCSKLDEHPAGAPEKDGEYDQNDWGERFFVFGHEDILTQSPQKDAEDE